MTLIDATTKVSLNNILYATDFSAAAERALPVAMNIARRYSAKIYGIHTRPPLVNPMTPPETWPALEESWEQAANADATKLERELRGSKHEVMVLEGDPISVLPRVIKEKNIDLIVIGTRGRTGVGKALLGSIAEEIFREVSCPVITVGPETPGASGPFEMKRILYATDFASQSPLAAAYAVSLAQENQSYLDLLHVLPPQKSGELVHSQELVTRTKHKLTKLVPAEAELWCVPQYLVEGGDPAEKILEVAHAHHADLIVLGVKASGGSSTHLPWAVAHKVVAHATCPVLTVRG